MEDLTTPILESENNRYDSDRHSPLKPVKIEETSQIHSTDSPPIKPTGESNEVKAPIPKSPLSNERIKAILESIEPIPRSKLPPNLSSSTSRFYDGALINLPSGWLIEQRPTTNQKYLEKTDQFFYEPYTDKQFQSLKAVWEYFSEENKKSQDGAVPPNPSTYHAPEKRKSGEANEHEQGSYPWDEMNKKNKKCGEANEQDSYIFNHENPPQSVTWCLENVEEDLWTPLVNGRKVPNEVKDSWMKILNSSMNADPNPDEVFLNKACGGK